MQLVIDGFGPLGLRAAARFLGIGHSLLHYHLERGTKPRACRHRDIAKAEFLESLKPVSAGNAPRPVLVRWRDGWDTEFDSISDLARVLGISQPAVSRALKKSKTIPSGWHELDTMAFVDDGRRRVYRRRSHKVTR